MSAASDALANGWALLLSVHGETERLGYIAASNVIRAESGEAIINESADAILSDDTQTVIDGIIDEGREFSINGVSTTACMAIVNATDVAGVERGALIVRRDDDQVFYVQEVWETAIDGSKVLILTRDAH